MSVPECCPLKLVLKDRGVLRESFDCSRCLVNPDYCRIFCGDQAPVRSKRQEKMREVIA